MNLPVNSRSSLSKIETVVVKVGSRVLSDSQGRLDEGMIGSIAEQLSFLVDQGKRVVLVSSGAVASGVDKLGLSRRPINLAELQAVAAVGQAKLIQIYERQLARFNRHVAQILLIADDLDDRTRYLNVRNTLLACLEMNLIPIINENDTVAVDELQTTFGDNDRLAAMVTGLFSKVLLIILSDVEGVYDRDPQQPEAKLIHLIESFDESVFALASSHRSQVSKGGMASKLKVAQFVTQSGSPVVIAGGRIDNVLPRLIAGEALGTFFLPQRSGMVPKKRWLGFSALPIGQLFVDEGAEKAIRMKGSSLLPIGIIRIEGQFQKGEVVSVRSGQNTEIARGLTNYDSNSLESILGLRSGQIAERLGHCPYAEVIHRDNMALV